MSRESNLVARIRSLEECVSILIQALINCPTIPGFAVLPPNDGCPILERLDKVIYNHPLHGEAE